MSYVDGFVLPIKDGQIDAYRALFEQWRLAFEIGSDNIRRGAQAWSLCDLFGLIRQYREPAGT